MIREISEALTDSFHHDGEHPDQYLRDLLNKKIGENPIEEMTPKLLKLIVHYLWTKEPAKDNLPIFHKDDTELIYFTEEQLIQELQTGEYSKAKKYASPKDATKTRSTKWFTIEPQPISTVSSNLFGKFTNFVN